jgi:hypothetical protein
VSEYSSPQITLAKAQMVAARGVRVHMGDACVLASARKAARSREAEQNIFQKFARLLAKVAP